MFVDSDDLADGMVWVFLDEGDHAGRDQVVRSRRLIVGEHIPESVVRRVAERLNWNC